MAVRLSKEGLWGWSDTPSWPRAGGHQDHSLSTCGETEAPSSKTAKINPRPLRGAFCVFALHPLFS